MCTPQLKKRSFVRKKLLANSVALIHWPSKNISPTSVRYFAIWIYHLQKRQRLFLDEKQNPTLVFSFALPNRFLRSVNLKKEHILSDFSRWWNFIVFVFMCVFYQRFFVFFCASAMVIKIQKIPPTSRDRVIAICFQLGHFCFRVKDTVLAIKCGDYHIWMVIIHMLNDGGGSLS